MYSGKPLFYKAKIPFNSIPLRIRTLRGESMLNLKLLILSTGIQ